MLITVKNDPAKKLNEPHDRGWLRDVIAFTCPAPPSANALFANVPGRGRVRTARYQKWAETAGWEIKVQVKGEQIKGDYLLSIWLPKGIDLDNVKAIADLLGPGKHGLGITDDDRNMKHLYVHRNEDLKKGECFVEISPP
jgi:hypothetical protein